MWCLIKGTVNVISSDSPWKDENALFTMVPLGFKVFNFNNSNILSCSINAQVTFLDKKLKMISQKYLIRQGYCCETKTWSDKDTVLKQILDQTRVLLWNKYLIRQGYCCERNTWSDKDTVVKEILDQTRVLLWNKYLIRQGYCCERNTWSYKGTVVKQKLDQTRVLLWNEYLITQGYCCETNTWSDKSTDVKRALPYLHGKSLKITLTVPLKSKCWKGIESLPQTLILSFLYLCNQMSQTLDISNYELYL